VFHSLMSGRFGAPANAALSAWIDEVGADNPLRGVDWLAYDRSSLPAETRAGWERAIAAFFRSRTKADIAGEGRRRGINAAVVQEPADVLVDPQLAARAFWAEELQRERRVRVPGSFLRVQPGPKHERTSRPVLAAGSGALGGVKILDLSWALVGSLATKALGDHGATVIKVESAQRPCLTRTDAQVARSSPSSFDDKPWFAHLNTSKLGIQLDLKHPRAREVLEPLIDWADVVVENFSPGTLDKLGLGYEALRERRPDLIMVSASAYGQTGPLAQSWGVDGTSGALSGRTWLTGWPDRGPVLPGAIPYADVVVPQFMVAALGAALCNRRETGQGCYIDVSMYEISVQQMAQATAGAQLGAAPARAGNRDAEVWHQGVYPTRGDDRWIAISLFDAADYRRLCEVLGGEWPDVEPLDADALDELLAERTRVHEDEPLMEALQAAGIAAGVVQDVRDLLERDPQLRARPAWTLVDHPVLGAFEHQTTPYHLARTPSACAAKYWACAPRTTRVCWPQACSVERDPALGPRGSVTDVPRARIVTLGNMPCEFG
ncbi:MAG TPA: CoA transferase, partial [Polyangiales bacterium]|nr:CoA transferase [Polyangiales bacterium]